MFAASKTAGVSGAVNYIEDVFSTWLYTGTGATQTITNSIDTTTYGGLVWIKGRSGATGHRLTDTVRGVTKSLASNSTAAQATETTGLTAFGTTGFTIGADADYNTSAATYVSWTFRKQPKFFDVVTFVAGSSTNRTISHSLGSTPAFYVMKDVSGVSQWPAYHTSLGANQYVALNKTDATTTYSGAWGTGPTSTTFSVDETAFCTSGNTYVVYLFASNAGGFGLTGTDNVISCGSYTADGSGNATVNLGYEPQWVLRKTINVAGDWILLDNMRGYSVSGSDNYLLTNQNYSEQSLDLGNPTATGFYSTNDSPSETYIYIAIRRGPMKVPTSGTSVFNPVTYTAAASTSYSTGLSYIDLMIEKRRDAAQTGFFYDRLRGNANRLVTSSTSSEITDANSWSNQFANQGTVTTASTLGSEWQGSQVIWNMRRAPSFMDVVCYTGTGSLQTQTHNLQAVPELIFFKQRSGANNWLVYNSTSGPTKYNVLNLALADSTGAQPFNNTAPTSTVFTVNTSGGINTSGQTYIAYLFATCTGVSKVGSYTGTGATQTISCGFTGGARFVLVKRTDSTGDWYVWDTARGMIAGTDPSLLLNSTAAEVNTNSIYTTTGGFQIVSTAAGINASGGTYIFLAIA